MIAVKNSEANGQSTSFPLENESDLGYGHLFEVLFRRKIWIIASIAIAMGIGAIYTLRQEPIYRSSMQLLIEPNYQSKDTGDLEEQFSGTNVEVDIATQLTLLRSTPLLERAMAKLQEIYPEFDVSQPGAVQLFRQSLQVVQLPSEGAGGRDTRRSSGIKIFRVDYASSDPAKTQRVLEALQFVYQQYNLEQQEERLAKGLSFINRKLPEVRAKVAYAEAALERFRKQQGVIDPESQAQTQVGILNSLEQELITTQARLEELKRLYSTLLDQINLQPEQALLASRLSQSSRYQTLLNQVQETELELVSQQLRFTNESPQIQQLREKRQRQQQLLRVELSRALNVSLPNVEGEILLYQGQLSPSEVSLINDLVSAQIELDTTQARYSSLLQARTEVASDLQRFPRLLAEYNRLLPEIQSNRETLQLLLTAQQELGLEIARGGFDWQVVEAPFYGQRTGPSLKINLLLAAVAGAMIGGTVAFIREAMDDSVHTFEELQRQAPVPLLGMVPVLRVQGSDFGRISRRRLANETLLAPAMYSILRWNDFREAMDVVQQNIQLVTSAAGLKSFVVTSALPGEGKSTLSLGLAFSAARLHSKVLLIDADLRRPSLHKLLNMPNEEGLSTFLASSSEVPMHLFPQSEDGRTGISVLTAGPVPADPAKLLSSRRMIELIRKFEQHYDLVIVDVPPVLGMVDSMVTATQCGGVLLVGRMDRLTKTELNQSIDRLRHLNVIGVVANGVASYQTPYSYIADSNSRTGWLSRPRKMLEYEK